MAYLAVAKEMLIPAPLTVLKRIIHLVRELFFWKSVFMSFLRISIGYALGVIIGTLLAAFTSTINFINELFKPIIGLVKATPVASFIILALVWIKKGNVPVFITFLIVLPIIWANMSEGIKSVDKSLLEMAKVYKFSFMKKVRLIYFHSVLPFFAAGCTTALGLAWKAGVAAEVIAMAPDSIGYNLYKSKITIETPDLFAWTAIVVIMSMILEKVVRALLKRNDRRKKNVKN